MRIIVKILPALLIILIVICHDFALGEEALQSRSGNPPAATATTEQRSTASCPDGMSWIPPGEFTMGCSVGDTYCFTEEKPPRKVRLTKGFCMDTREVMQKDYERVMGNNPSFLKSCGPDCPVENLYWFDAREYCSKLGKRLPTEAEWEYAARGGSATKFFWGDEMDGDYAWYGGNSGPTTHPAGTKKPNGFGLHDMLGNAWEWVEDCYDRRWYDTMSKTDPVNLSPETCNRVIRGSSWLYFTKYLRVSMRLGLKPDNECIPVGFRCAKD